MDRRQPVFLGLTVLIVTGALGVAGYNHRRASEVELRRATFAHERASSTTMSQRAIPASDQAAPAESTAAKSAENPTANARRTPAQEAEVQALHLAAERVRAEMSYAPLFRSLGLSPTQRAAFLENLRRHRENTSDLHSVESTPYPDENADAVLSLRERIERDYEKAQRSLLGEAGFRIAKEFESTLMVREDIASVAGTAVMAGVPLTAQQAEELTRIVVANAHKHRTDVEWVDTDAVDWDEVDGQAREVLSAEQLAVFQASNSGVSGRFSTRLSQAVEAARKSDYARKNKLPP